MNRWGGRWLLVGMVVLGVSALAQKNNMQDKPRQPEAEVKRPYPLHIDEMALLLVAPTKASFLEQLHYINQMEMALGELTQQKAWLDDTQEYGEMLHKEHKQADQLVLQLAQKQGYRIGPWEPTNDVQRRIRTSYMATKAKLAVLMGPLYDQQFLAAQVSLHDEAIALATVGGQRYPEFSALVEQFVPILQRHRERAYQILGEAQQLAPLPENLQIQPAQRRQARPPPPRERP